MNLNSLHVANLEEIASECLSCFDLFEDDALSGAVTEGGRTVRGLIQNAILANHGWTRILAARGKQSVSEEEVSRLVETTQKKADLIAAFQSSVDSLREAILELSESDLTTPVSVPWLHNGQAKELGIFLHRPGHNLSFTLGQVEAVGESLGVIPVTPPFSTH